MNSTLAFVLNVLDLDGDTLLTVPISFNVTVAVAVDEYSTKVVSESQFVTLFKSNILETAYLYPDGAKFSPDIKYEKSVPLLKGITESAPAL